MKKLVLAAILIVVVVAALLAAGCGDSIPKGAIAKVGDGVVTQAQFDQFMNQAEEQSKSQPGSPPFPSPGTPSYDQYAAQLVDYLVTQELLIQKAADMKLTVSDQELQQRIDQMFQGVGGEKKAMELLKKQGMTVDQLKMLTKNEMLAQKVYAKITGDAKPTEQQLKDYYEKNKAQFDQPETRDVRHVMVKSKAEAEKVRALLVADDSTANWKKVAKKYSDDPGTKDNGGNLGPVKKGMMAPPFEKAAWALKVNEISQPVKTQFGWHVLKVVSKSPAKESTYEGVKGRIAKTLAPQLQQETWQKWFDQAKKDADIKYAPGYDPAQLTAAPTPAPSQPAQQVSPTPKPSSTK